MEALMMTLTILGILVSGLGVWFSWKAMNNAKDAQKAAEDASQAIKVRKNIESLSEVILILGKAIKTLNKRLSNNTERGADINTENQLLRDCTDLVSRNERRIKNTDNQWKVKVLRKSVERRVPNYKEGQEINKVAEEMVSDFKEIRQIFASENENAIY